MRENDVLVVGDIGKMVVDIHSGVSGTVKDLHINIDDVIEPDDVICTIE